MIFTVINTCLSEIEQVFKNDPNNYSAEISETEV